ncbi:MAG: DUF2807 domain-containing protein [Candidatus Marinimicrobia bacterium]|nr:DUF2807 domain-containing protein [Candidatus Neomarinimicrobiota bacterium]
MKKILFPLLIVVFLFGCSVDTGKIQRLVVTGDIVSERYEFGSFTEVMIAGPMSVVLDQTPGNRAEVETYESLMELFRAEIVENTLVLYILDTTSTFEFNTESELGEISKNALISGSRIKWPDNKKVLNVHLFAPDVQKITVVGECDMNTAQPFRAPELEFEVAGVLHLNADLEVERFGVEIAGVANLELRGSTEDFTVECAGVGTINAFEFIADNVTMDVAGVCNGSVYARTSIDVELAGMGTITYKGSPGSVSFEKAGFGKIKQAESDDTEI